jgi:hypothetical protein
MFRTARLPFFLVSVFCALALLPASAQGPNPFPPLEEMEGLETAVLRSYDLDFSQFEAVPDGSDTEEAEYRDALALAGFVLEFDSADHATGAYDAIVANGVGEIGAAFGFENPELTELDLDDIGERAHAFSLFNATGSTEGYVRMVVMQAESYVFLSLIITEAEESSLDADALIAHFAEGTSDGHSGTGTFAEGTSDSSDGLWAFFPDADHVLWAGLAPEGDQILFPVLEQ